MCASNEVIKVAGIVRNSFVDWPGKIAFVVFLGGCNFNCPHCHNYDILTQTSNNVSFDCVLEEVKYQIGFVDGVVLSGGEPTMHPKIREIISEIRSLGLPVKLDTNGSNFLLLKELVMAKVIDYVAMDIKAPIERYAELGFVGGKNADIILENIKSSIEFLQTCGVPHIFRTTPLPELTDSDLDGAHALAGNDTWVKNHYVAVGGTK